MNIKYGFNPFLKWSLKILFLVIVCGSIFYMKDEEPEFTLLSISLFVGTLMLVIGTYYSLKNNKNTYFTVVIILIIALILRILWFYNIDSIPIGDFNRMFICAGEFLEGTTYMFKETAYMARFPHMSITVLYFSLIRKLFGNPLIAIRSINIIFSMINVVLLFLLAKEVFKDKNKSIWILLIGSIYPPMIIYNNVYCSENIAMPLLLFSVLMFLKSFNNKDKKHRMILILVSGMILGLTHLFRPIGYVMIVAYVMFILIYFNENIKRKILMNTLIVGAFIFPILIVSSTLMKLDIIENPIWRGTEPPSISILKGTNIDSEGRWNEEDASLFDMYDRDYEKVDKAAKAIIKERLTTNSVNDLFEFYTMKYAKQWYAGDFGGLYWSENGLDEAYNKDEYLDMLGKSQGRMLIRLSEEGEFYVQVFFIVVLVLTYIGLYRNKNHNNYSIDLFYIMFCGISLQCLMMESQDRYTYPFSWIFIILSMTAFNKVSLGNQGGNHE